MFAFTVKLKSSAATVKPVFSELNNINTACLAASHSPFSSCQHIAFEIPAFGLCIAFRKLLGHSLLSACAVGYCKKITEPAGSVN
jgi:hypothetical protein